MAVALASERHTEASLVGVDLVPTQPGDRVRQAAPACGCRIQILDAVEVPASQCEALQLVINGLVVHKNVDKIRSQQIVFERISSIATQETDNEQHVS